MLRWILLLVALGLSQETVILQTAPETQSQKFSQAMRDLNASLQQIGQARREDDALDIQRSRQEMEMKRFELDVLDRAIKFEKEYPGEPNPYREFMKGLKPQAAIAPTPSNSTQLSAPSQPLGSAKVFAIVLFIALAGVFAIKAADQ